MKKIVLGFLVFSAAALLALQNQRIEPQSNGDELTKQIEELKSENAALTKQVDQLKACVATRTEAIFNIMESWPKAKISYNQPSDTPPAAMFIKEELTLTLPSGTHKSFPMECK